MVEAVDRVPGHPCPAAPPTGRVVWVACGCEGYGLEVLMNPEELKILRHEIIQKTKFLGQWMRRSPELGWKDWPQG